MVLLKTAKVKPGESVHVYISSLCFSDLYNSLYKYIGTMYYSNTVFHASQLFIGFNNSICLLNYFLFTE